MNISIKAVNKHLSEIMEAFTKNEQVVLSHEGKTFALLQPVPDIEDEIRRIKKHPAIGMWADREDMKDPVAWVRAKRDRRREKIFTAADGDGE